MSNNKMKKISGMILKFTKIWFIVCGTMQFIFGMAFVFFWDLFANLIKFPYDDPALPYVFGTAAFGYSALSFLSAFLGKDWNSVKIPVLAEIIWCGVSILAMLYLQYGYIALHPINWMNTLSYALFMVGFIVVYIMQTKNENS
jgi:uncharacterized membrane protein HdeD (DUF308 family)